MESENLEFFNKVRKGYLKRADEEPDRFIVIDASKPLKEVQIQIASELDRFFNL